VIARTVDLSSLSVTLNSAFSGLLQAVRLLRPRTVEAVEQVLLGCAGVYRGGLSSYRDEPASANRVSRTPSRQGTEQRGDAINSEESLTPRAAQRSGRGRFRRRLHRLRSRLYRTAARMWSGRRTRPGPPAQWPCVWDLTEPISAHHIAVSAGRRLAARLNARPLSLRPSGHSHQVRLPHAEPST
jgi:hypothetical protein